MYIVSKYVMYEEKKRKIIQYIILYRYGILYIFKRLYSKCVKSAIIKCRFQTEDRYKTYDVSFMCLGCIYFCDK